jgi:hypothetical protein
MSNGNIILTIKLIKQHGLHVWAVVANDTMILATAMSEQGARSIALRLVAKKEGMML